MTRISISLGFVLMATAAQAADTYTTPFDPGSFTTFGMAVNDVPLYVAAYRNQMVEGGIEVCGALHVHPGQEEFVMARVAEGRAIIRVDWDDVFEMPADFSYFTAADSAGAVETMAATCRVFGPVPEFEEARPYHVFGSMFDF